jgi:hypothetical protein
MSKKGNRLSINIRTSNTKEISRTNSKNENQIPSSLYSSIHLSTQQNEPISLKNIIKRKKTLTKENNQNLKESKTFTKENIRKDARGYPIVKGNKKYKVTFKDLISKENLVNYIDIEKFNKSFEKQSQISDFDKKDNTSCACIIF